MSNKLKNKFKNYCIAFRSLVFLLSFLVQSCTKNVEKRTVAAQKHCDIDKTLSIDPYSSGDEWNMYNTKEFRSLNKQFVSDVKTISTTAINHVAGDLFADLLKEGAIFTAASSLGAVGLTVYGATKVVDFALSLPALKDQLENIIENYDDISHETKIETGTKVACDFILGGFLKSGRKVASSDTLRMCAKEGVEKIGKKVGNIQRVPENNVLKAFPNTIEVKRKTPVQGGGQLRPRWKDKKGKIYEWDFQEGHVEIYNKTGKKHLGAFDPDTGKKLKDGIPTRSVSP